MEQVVLVDSDNNELGTMEKIKAHKKGVLHRAISVFVFNSKGELLIQQRAKHKYHCPKIWANTCCTHPLPNESFIDSAKRRLKEEVGFETELKQEFCFVYKSKFDNGLTEHEYDCVFTGMYDGKVKPNPDEVMDYKWISLKELKQDTKNYPDKYASWFEIALEKLTAKLRRDEDILFSKFEKI
ncbi:isopentenyl-diphosphate Delta-isomerase [Candidatus Woesearchaeota archaeon]|nr:isopentenyl-diphosphate Delta-isomerase [Candidatus Woesearchaeota archaeon]